MRIWVSYYLWLHASFGHQTLLCAFHHPRWYLCRYQAPVSIHTSNNNKLLFSTTLWSLLLKKIHSRVLRSWFGLLWLGMDNLSPDELQPYASFFLLFQTVNRNKCCARKTTHFESIVSDETAFCSLDCSSLKLFKMLEQFDKSISLWKFWFVLITGWYLHEKVKFCLRKYSSFFFPSSKLG